MKQKTFEQVAEDLKDKRILVANRGISARRIARSIRDVFQAVPVMTVTEVDKTAPFTAGAQELLLLGENPRAYLNIELIIALAKARGIMAIHPGWGFASEDDAFPMECKKAGIIFIGPDTEPMHLLGNKVAVRNLAAQLNIPIVPGSEGAVSIEEAGKAAEKIGFPIMLKAEGGGGGRGIYEIYNADQLETAFDKASALAHATFGNPRVYIEKLLTSVRHIEIQVVADRYGNAFAFDERDCSIQRNHQKLVEITPSPWPGMTSELRVKLKEYALRLIREVGYHSLATVEFLIEEDGTPYLIEVNTRLQVEHGITECRYGIDLVEEQIAIAFGAKLRFNEQKTRPLNYAMQVRINCEDPRDNFAPNSGVIHRYISPGGPGIRLDSCVSAGYEFPPQYDSAASLLAAYGRTWPKVLGIMDRALREYIVGGLKTTIPFLRQIINHPRFRSGECDTKFILNTPELRQYKDNEPEALRLTRLVAEISARGYNPFVDLGEYRGREDKRLGKFEPVLPEMKRQALVKAYPAKDRKTLLDFVRDSGYVHFTDTTTRDTTQSNSGNRFRLGEDMIVGPYLDECGFFSLETGGGAHFHVAMMANMTYPFNEARSWNIFAPKTAKQVLVRSTNLLGYKPQPKNLMQATGEMICSLYDIIRCFDFLNHIENMKPLAEVVMNSPSNVFEPAISLSWARGFEIPHYLEVLEEIVTMVAKVSGVSNRKATERFIIGLKDMAGVCPPRFIGKLVEAIRKKYPGLVIHYHRHCTDGLFVPAVGAAALAGANIVDTAIGAAVRWYGQGEVLSTAAYLEDELGLKTNLNKNMIRDTGFVLKQIMPYYDRYVAPYFQGVDYDVISHAMPGGATSSSQEGALKQGYIHLLPHMLTFLAGTRKIIRYHDVTPGSQITWNTAFLAVTAAFNRGGEKEVQRILEVLEAVADTPEDALSDALKTERLILYRESNDAFRQLLHGKFGRLPLGFPADWVYESAFGSEYKKIIASRSEASPLNDLPPMDIEEEKKSLLSHLKRQPTEEELMMYLNHPGDALKTMRQRQEFGNPNRLPLDVWFEGLETGRKLDFNDSDGKPHQMTILDISRPDDQGMSLVRYDFNAESILHPVKVAEAVKGKGHGVEKAMEGNPYHVGAPSNGDLWIVYVKPGDIVKKGESLFNITIMKQEKAVSAPVEGMVKRVLKFADYKKDKKMVPVQLGELIVELCPVPRKCPNCSEPVAGSGYKFCPGCGAQLA
ncbi:MAG: pyruvate carboxylase [Proteobacteria bacterium]|nr:pyruvate carboxylase [Pseudomonadota bacterium]MCG2751172.1 pyruvate carboxylase [Desulfobacteraceae bacterium]